MSAGFEVINDGGVLIVDENYICLALRASGTATAGTISGEPDNGGMLMFADINYNGAECPLLVIYKPQQGGRTDVGAGVWGARRNGDGSWTFRVGVIGDPNFGGVDNSFAWYIYDRPARIDSGGTGVEVFDAGGGIVFSSNWRLMKIVGSGPITGLPSGKYGFLNAVSLAVQNEQTTGDPDTHGNIQIYEYYRITYAGYYCTSDGVYGATCQTGGLGRFDFNATGDLDGGGVGAGFVANLAGI